MFYGFVITEAGNNLLAKMVAGDKLTITKVVMDKGTAESAEAARKLTAPIDPGPNGTSTVPTVEGAAVNMLVEYRSDLNGGLQEGFWIGGFAVFGKVENGTETMIYYGSLGEQKQYVSAYVEGTAPDVRRYPVSITVTAGVEVEVSYPAEAWMTAEDVAEYFNGTLKPQLEESLDDLIDEHNKDPNAHNGALKDKQDAIKVEGLLKGTKTTGEGGDTYKVGAAKPGTDYQQPTNTLPAAEEMTTQDYIPFVNHETGQHMRATLQSLKEAIGVQSPTIKVTTCEGAAVTCSDGVTTLEGTGTTEFELPNVGNWTVTAQLSGQSASQVVQVSGALLYEVDLMITRGIAVTTQPNKKTYYIGEAFDPEGMVVTAHYTDSQSRTVTGYTYSPNGALGMEDTTITVSYTEGDVTKTDTQAITVARALDHIAVTHAPNRTNYFSGEQFSTAGMVVTAYYTDSSSRAVSGYTYSPAGALTSGNTSITIFYAEGGVTKTTTQAITVTTINTTLNSNSWATIKAVSDAGKGDDYWDVGDTKTITINGTVQGFTFSNLSIAVFILGFNHNSSREGNNRIHFQIGKISNKLVGLCDSNYGSYVSSGFCMNTEQTNRGGWSNSHMRKTVLGNSGAPSSPPANSLLAALPADLRAVMKSVSKYSDNTGGGYDTASYVTATTDWLFLLAEFEYHGSRRRYANSAEQNYQKQYDYYKAGNSKVHYRHDSTGTAVAAWTRSANVGNGGSFCLVNEDGTTAGINADYSWALAPGFVV